LAARGWLRGPHTPHLNSAGDEATFKPLELGLLPFGIDEALLPGETKQVHLYEARFIQLFEHALERHDSCLGALLITPRGSVAAVTTLLEMEEFRREEFGVWAQLKCVGRVKLREVRESDYLYVAALVEPFFDAPSPVPQGLASSSSRRPSAAAPSDEAAEMAAEVASRLASEAAAAAGVSEEAVLAAATDLLANLESEVREVHESVRAMRVKLRRAEEGKDEGKGGKDDRVTWGHEVRDETLELEVPLDKVYEKRRGVLTSAGPDAAPLSCLSEPLGEVWNVKSEADAERQLLSFAAAATLSPSERAQALGMTDTDERLTHVLCALRQQQRRLAALLALKDAGPG